MALSTGAIALSVRDYWREIGGGRVRLAHVLSAFDSAARMKNLSGGTGEGCNFEDGAAESGDCTISNSDVTMGVKGETFQISLRDADGNKITGLLWVSSDLSVCSVDGTGVVKAEGKGTAYVSTTYNGVTYQCIVRCNIK